MSSVVRMPSRRSTRTWLPATALASGPFTYVPNLRPACSCSRVFSCSLPHVVSFQILRVVEIEKSEDVRRPYIKQLLVPKLKFPLPHRVQKVRSTFVAHRPSTF